MERLGYQRMADFLNAYQDGAELNCAMAYLHRDDEVQMNRLIYAIRRAFNGDGEQQPEQPEKVWDTTDPEFAKNFKGFI